MKPRFLSRQGHFLFPFLSCQSFLLFLGRKFHYLFSFELHRPARRLPLRPFSKYRNSSDFPISPTLYYKQQQAMGPYLAQPITQKIKSKAENQKLKLRFAKCQMQGWRRSMQDSAIAELDIGNGNSLFGVFDGHGGLQVSKLVQKIFITQLKNTKLYKQQKYPEALVEAFKRIDQIIESKEGQDQLKIIRKKYDASSYSDTAISLGTGCTACVVLITATKIITANAGDSRAVLCRKGHCVPLSNDHKPQNETERKRIYAAGGEIINGRVNGGLNLSRSFGDFNYKKLKNKAYDEQPIISKPDITQIPRKSGDDQFIILGCDGIWQRYTNDSQPLITRIANERKMNNDGQTILVNLLDQTLAKQSTQETGCDNMTSILIQFS